MSLELGRLDAKIEVWDTLLREYELNNGFMFYEAPAAGRCNYSETNGNRDVATADHEEYADYRVRQKPVRLLHHMTVCWFVLSKPVCKQIMLPSCFMLDCNFNCFQAGATPLHAALGSACG